MLADIDIPLPETTTDLEYVVVSDEDLEKPYRVIIENDDVTPMDFVVLVLLTIFDLPMDRAERVMLEAHNKGHAYVRTLPFEDARQRVYTAHSLARASGYPLSFYLEPDA
ncbi:MAG TPA: ATP-dependent Clp protease adaptor ClpS [Roseiflexaceae bacterium]